ncbi:MAG: response regulator [Fidelibacterota bacterium]|nr:MAG: response regulator [Candidatus Neomarinimicrobiota bacterium]
MMGKILIVEDDEIYSRVIRLYLEEKLNHEVHVLHDGESAIAELPDIMPDVIILDIILPGMSGFAVCNKIKHDSAYKDIPIIMLSVKSEIKDIKAAMHAGADDYITKKDTIDSIWEQLEIKIDHAMGRDNGLGKEEAH